MRCKTIGPNDLLRRVRQFNFKQVHPEIAARSKEILQRFRLDDVRDKSEGAAAFYVWVNDIIVSYSQSQMYSATLNRQLNRKGIFCTRTKVAE